jgi:hypothetical protein
MNTTTGLRGSGLQSSPAVPGLRVAGIAGENQVEKKT